MLSRFAPRRKKQGNDKTSLQTKPIFAVAGGIDLSVPPVEIGNTFVRWANNVYFHQKKIKKRAGYAKFGTEVSLAGDSVMHIQEFFKFDGTKYLCAFTTKNAYLYNTTTLKWDLITEHEDVSDCEAAWVAQANVVATASTTKRYGTYAAKLAIASGKTGLCATRAITSDSYAGDTHLYFYIRSSKALTAGQFQILLDDTATCASPLELLDIPAVPIADTWYEFCVALATPAALTAVISVGLNAIADLAGVDIYLDEIMAVNCLTGTVVNRFESEQIFDDTAAEMKFVITNGLDVIKYWNGSGNWATLSGSPNKAKFMSNFEHYLMLGNVTVSGVQAAQRIDWPQIGKPTIWTGEDAGNNSLAGNTDFIEGMVAFRSNFYIFKKTSISLVYFVGGVNPFEYSENKIQDVGCIAAGSIQSMGSILFLGPDNVYSFDGFSVTPVGDKVVERLVDELNPNKLTLVHSHMLKEFNLYLLFVPSTNASYPDQVWAYEYMTGSWSFWKFNDLITATGFYFTPSSITIAGLTQLIGNLKFRLGSKYLQSLNTFSLLGSSDGYIYKYDPTVFSDNGVAIDGYVDTRSYVFGGINLYNLLCQIALFGNGDNISVSVSVNDGVYFKPIGTITQVTSTELAAFLRKIDVIGDRFMVRFQNNTINEWFEISGWELGYIERARVV